MTCGACAARIERRLNRLDGVAATVNYATGRAYFTSTGGRDPAELIGVIESAGYTAERPAPPSPDGPPGADPQTRALARRLVVCVPLAVAVIVLSMVPAAQFPGWQWVSLLLAAPVATWGAWPLYRAAWYGLGYGAATMDTLVSVGRRRVLLLVGVRAAVRRRGHDRDEDVVRLHLRPGQREHAVPGGRGRGDRGGAGRAVPGGPGPGPVGPGAERAGRAGGQDGRGAARRVRAAGPGGRTRGRGPVRGPPGGEDRHRRDRGRGQLGGGRVAGHRRVDAGRGRPGRPGDRGHGEHERPAGGAGHPGRLRYPAGADHPPGQPGAGHQGRARSGWPTGSPRCSSRA